MSAPRLAHVFGLTLKEVKALKSSLLNNSINLNNDSNNNKPDSNTTKKRRQGDSPDKQDSFSSFLKSTLSKTPLVKGEPKDYPIDIELNYLYIRPLKANTFLLFPPLNKSPFLASYMDNMASAEIASHTSLRQAAIQLKSGDYKQALYFFEQGLKTAEKEPRLHLGSGLALSYLDRYNEAFDCFITSLKIDPELSLAHLLLGDVCAKQERYQEAHRHFSKALQTDASKIIAREALLSLAWMEIILGRFEECVETTTKALDLGHENNSIHSLLCSAYRGLRRPQEALHHANRALWFNHRDVIASHNAGIINYYHNDFGKAYTLFSRVCNMDEGNAIAQLYLCVTSKQRNQIDLAEKAWKQYKQAITSEPLPSQLKTALHKLEKGNEFVTSAPTSPDVNVQSVGGFLRHKQAQEAEQLKKQFQTKSKSIEESILSDLKK
ncbi:MAG: tetratricopeptide repeat protein [Fibrobacteria bacterium]|nr:tetratricopeptide repeat protein [Fibrobacteria bacterium]